MLAEDRVGIVCDAVQSRRMRRASEEEEEEEEVVMFCLFDDDYDNGASKWL